MKNSKKPQSLSMKERMKKIRSDRNGETLIQKQRPARKFGLMFATAVISTAVFAKYCPPFMDSVFPVYITQHYTTLGTKNLSWLSRHDATISQNLTNQREEIVEAIKVLTKQKNVVGISISDTMTRTAQTQAATYQSMQVAQKQKEIAMQYGPMGQGYKNCQVLAERGKVVANQDAARDSVLARVSNEVIAAPGTYSDPIKAQKQMLADHDANYCTPDQVASNLCSGGGASPGLSLQAATLFTEAAEGSSVHKAQNALINNMVGLPDAPVSAQIASTPVGEHYLAAKLAKDAKISPAINSLKAIQSEFTSISEGNTGVHGSEGLPLIAQFRKEVNRYLGFDNEYKEWNKALTSQEERGVLKEILQVKALKLAIGERKYRSNERVEAMLASLVSMEQELSSGEYDLNISKSASSAETKKRIALSQSLRNSVTTDVEKGS